MTNVIRAALVAAVLSLAGCGGGVDIPTKVQEGIANSCNFLADIKWVRDIVSKMDVTAATINEAVTMVCNGLNPVSFGLLHEDVKCPKGEIVVNGETICIEGDYIEPPKNEEK
jgi:hypothetical protein